MPDQLRPDHLAYWKRLVAERTRVQVAIESYGRFLADEYAEGGAATLLDDGTLVRGEGAARATLPRNGS